MADRVRLMWVKAINRGPALHHAGLDLIAALQTLKAQLGKDSSSFCSLKASMSSGIKL